MKTKQSIVKTSMLAVISFLVFTACEKQEATSVESIEGTYVGTFTREDGLKHLTQSEQNTKATAVVRQTEEDVIEVRFQSHMLDTSLMLNHYDHHDSVKVCLTGNDFENMYGHMLGEGHMSGGMMGHMHDGETEWMHHMNDEHQDGDEHFGGFDMNRHTFGFQFRMNDEVPYHLNFQGNKQ